MSGESPVWARAAATAGLVLLTSYAFFSRAFFEFSLLDAYVSISFACGTIVLFRIQPSWQKLLQVALISGVVAIIDIGFLGYRPYYPVAFTLVCLSYIGISSFVVLGVHAAWATGEKRKLLVYTLLPMFLFSLVLIPDPIILDLMEKLRPLTFDLYLYSFDASLGMQASFVLGTFVFKSAWIYNTTLLLYIALPIPLAVVFAGNIVRNRKHALCIALAFLLAGPLGLFFYNMLPALGPVHIFQTQFPGHPLSMADAARMVVEPITVKGTRNAMPSLHMAWILLAWWNACGLRKVERWIVYLFVFFTVLSTLGLGEHYLIDLVVAYPFALMVQALSSFIIPLRDARRMVPLLAGMSITLAWLGLLSYATKLFWISPLLPWSLVLATVAVSIFLQRRLFAARMVETMPAHPAMAREPAVVVS